MSLDSWISKSKVQVDDRCWSKVNERTNCKNKATKHCHDDLVYIQCCDLHFEDWKDLSNCWKEGINLSRQILKFG